MSIFKKVFIILIFVLIIESLIICLTYKNTLSTAVISEFNPKEKLVILIDITSNNLSIFQKNKLLKTYTIAGGKPSTPSPLGTWTIIDKGPWGEGFGGRWMGLNVPCPTY